MSEEIVREIEPDDCVKPSIGYGGYYLRWSASSPGIPRKEAAALKTFFRNVVPHLKKMIEASQEIQCDAEKERNLGTLDLNIHAFSPFVHLSFGVGVTYDVSTTWDGVYFIDRTEEVYCKRGKEKSESGRFFVKWEIGEVVQDSIASSTPSFPIKTVLPRPPLVKTNAKLGTLLNPSSLGSSFSEPSPDSVLKI